MLILGYLKKGHPLAEGTLEGNSADQLGTAAR
jgi:hypothetical protein